MNIKSYLIYRDIRYTFISFWIILAVVSILCVVFDMKELVWGIVLAFLLTPILINYWGYRKSYQIGRKLFFTKVGYCAMGIALSLVTISLIFNLSYEPGWFNFTDFGFYVISFPLISFFHFEFNNELVFMRFLLYIAVFFNLAILIFITDFVGLCFYKLWEQCRVIIGYKKLDKKESP